MDFRTEVQMASEFFGHILIPSIKISFFPIKCVSSLEIWGQIGPFGPLLQGGGAAGEGVEGRHGQGGVGEGAQGGEGGGEEKEVQVGDVNPDGFWK